MSRPAYTLNPNYTPRDCDDKAVLIASWLHGHGYKCRFVVSSCSPTRELCHVFVQLKNGVFFDATYSDYRDFLGSYPYFAKITRLDALTDWI